MKKLLLLLFMLLGANALAAVNKWVDERGQVHYSDQPPPANVKKAQTLPPAPAPEATPPAKTTGAPAASAPAATTTAASAPAATKTAAERDAELKKAKDEAAKKAAQEQAIADTYKANCDNAQRNLRMLQSGMRIAEIDANGQRYYLSDAQRQERISKAQQDIATYCK